jgi:cysteine sulfinate desulfinase/cysteine desulfurase-like protein
MDLPIYLDFNATTPVADEVIEAVQPFLFAVFGDIRDVCAWFGAPTGRDQRNRASRRDGTCQASGDARLGS